MIRRVINTVMLALIFCQSAFAAGSLFAIQESGAALEAPATITICANIDAPASCQRYIVRHTTLSILTTTGRSYARSGIKMDTSTFKVLNAYCSTTANGYCSLPLNNHTPTEIPITTVGVRLHATPAAHTEVDVTYTQQNIATGGIEPYTYSVVDGTLPAGTTLQANGTVSGTPTTHGAFSYTIQVAGALGTTDTALTSGTIARRLVITHTASADNQVGITYLQTNVASGGTAPYTYSVASGEIPAGTNLDTTTGTVSGTPTTAAAYSYTINVVDSDGGSKTTPAITGTISGRVGLNATPSTYTEVNVLYSQANVATNGTAPFHYTLDSGLLPAGTSLDPDTGTVSGPPQVTASGPFSYRIKVTDDDGAMATATTSGTINAALSTTNPSAVIADAGQTASFSAVASDGTAPYSYQWQVKPNGNTSFLNITGANSSSYTTNTLNTSNNNDQYRLKVTDAGSATATSTAATLTVHTALASSPTPVSPVADAGQTIAFGAGVTGGSNSFTYQWQVSTNGGTSFADVTTGSGGQTATYTTATLTTTNNNDQYQVIVTDTGTSTHRVVTSAARTLTVNTALASAPTPASPVADAGQTIAFDAGVTGGSGTFTYQWQYKPSGGSFSDISGAVSASYTTAALTTANSGDQYKVIVTDTGTSVATSVTSAARTLTVNTALNITTQPSTQAITLAGGSPTATFTVVAADGSPAYSYQWQFQSQGVGPFVNVGTNAASYTTAGLTLGNNNDVYQVIVTDSATVPTSVTSNTATLNVTALRATSPGQDFSNGAMSSKAWDSAAISPDQLTAISCPSTSFCMAVDTDGTAFRYDGLNWTSADKIDTGHSFKSVSCASSDHCIAVDNSGYAFLYNGTWSTGAQFDTSGEPVSVSCPNSSFCMVIDNNANAFAYNGATWSSAESVGIASDLTAVSCTSDTECVAVDAQGNSSRYDGTVWTAYSANPISSYGLNAVSCTPNSGSFCMAVDSAGNAFGYNGTTWSHQYDDGAIDSDSLNSVSCLGTAFCMVVDSNGGALRYNGVTWSAVSDIDGTHSISSLSCPTAAFCMGVDKAGNAWKYLASAANIAQANSGDDDAAEKTPVAQTFSVKARDNTAATYKITGLKQPEGVHIDTNNNLWIADEVGAKVYRLPASANGELSDNTPALVSITNSASMSPTSVVTDAEGNIYVADRDNAIFIYPAATYQTPGNYSDAVPSRTIAGEDTGLNTPLALALDSQHNIWVANQNGNSIEQFAAGTDGDSNSIKPTVTISGAKTLLEEPNGIFMDTMGNIWVTNAKVNKIYVFAAGTEGNAAPTCVITNEAINNPVGISLDSQGNIYQANDVESGGAINIFEPVSANCGTTTVSPMRHIAGVSTSIGKSLGLSIGYVF